MNTCSKYCYCSVYTGGRGCLHSTVVFMVQLEIRKTQVPIPPLSETENRHLEAPCIESAPVVQLDLNRRNNKRCIIYHSFVLRKMTLQIYILIGSLSLKKSTKISKWCTINHSPMHFHFSFLNIALTEIAKPQYKYLCKCIQSVESFTNPV